MLVSNTSTAPIRGLRHYRDIRHEDEQHHANAEITNLPITLHPEDVHPTLHFDHEAVPVAAHVEHHAIGAPEALAVVLALSSALAMPVVLSAIGLA